MLWRRKNLQAVRAYLAVPTTMTAGAERLERAGPAFSERSIIMIKMEEKLEAVLPIFLEALRTMTPTAAKLVHPLRDSLETQTITTIMVADRVKQHRVC